MHLSRVPDGEAIEKYDGSGKWVKFYTLGLEIRKERPDAVLWLPMEGGEKYPTRVSAHCCIVDPRPVEADLLNFWNRSLVHYRNKLLRGNIFSALTKSITRLAIVIRNFIPLVSMLRWRAMRRAICQRGSGFQRE